MSRAGKWAVSLNSHLHHLSLKQRLLLYFLLLLLVSYTGTGMLLNQSITRQMEGAYTDFTRQTLSQAMLDLENRIGNMDKIMGVIQSDRGVLSYLKTMDDADGTQVRKLFGSIKDQYPEVLGIALIDQSGTLISNEMYQPETVAEVTEPWRMDMVVHKDPIQFLSRPYGRNMAYYDSISSDRILSVLKPIPGPDNSVLGILSVDMDVELLKAGLDRFKLGKNGFVYILDPEGSIAYAPENPIVPRMKLSWFKGDLSGTFSRTILGVPFQVIYETSRYTGFKVVGVFPENETLDAVTEFRVYFITIIGLILGLSLLGAQRISDTVVRPLEKLKELMGRAEKGDLSVSFNPQYMDEIGQLGVTFDRMIIEIRNLIDQVRMEQASKRRAELRVLQAQINPHFLYNTFDTIHWMLKKYNANDVILMVSRLTDLFRISLSGGNDIITLGDEIRHVEAYLDIQRVRYEDLLDYRIGVPESIRSLYVCKLILQPLVENAIYHGIKNRDTEGLVSIRGRVLGKVLVLEVEDNGPGMSELRMADLRIKLEDRNLNGDAASGKGYGLFNVHERLRLNFGTEFGISIDSQAGEWCRISIFSPVMEKVGEISDS